MHYQETLYIREKTGEVKVIEVLPIKREVKWSESLWISEEICSKRQDWWKGSISKPPMLNWHLHDACISGSVWINRGNVVVKRFYYNLSEGGLTLSYTSVREGEFPASSVVTFSPWGKNYGILSSWLNGKLQTQADMVNSVLMEGQCYRMSQRKTRERKIQTNKQIQTN